MSSAASQKVVSSLIASGGTATARQISKDTSLPLALVVRSLQTRANELTPDVKRVVTDDEVVYEYIGLEPIPGRSTAAEASTSEPEIAPSAETEPTSTQEETPPAESKKPSPRKKSEKAKKPQAKVHRISEAKKPTDSVKPSKAQSDDWTPIYLAVASTLLNAPMNLTRLSKETGYSSKELRPVLEALVAADLVTGKEMMDDIVYRSEGDLEKKIESATLPHLLWGKAPAESEISVQADTLSRASEEALKIAQSARSTMKKMADRVEAMQLRVQSLRDILNMLESELSDLSSEIAINVKDSANTTSPKDSEQTG